MVKKGNKKFNSGGSSKNIINPSYVLKIKAYASICKPLNGSLPRSNQSHFLKLAPITYRYKNGKDSKETEVTAYHIKGIRGAVRHAVMKICHAQGLEVCHTSDKEADSSGNSLIPAGFHLAGKCINGANEDECIVHAIFGSKGHEGKIRVFIHPIANISHKTFETDFAVQNVQLATENRVCMSFDNKPVQDFKERYFSGEFTFEIDVTQLNTVERGLIIKSVIAIERLGRGFNAGYGHVKIQEFQLLKRVIRRTTEWTDDKFTVKEEITEESLKQEVLEAMEAWQQYLN
ncbi:MAG: RAMP superfamily CRISPR-associated protein [Promethearchaeota archaeon]